MEDMIRRSKAQQEAEQARVCGVSGAMQPAPLSGSTELERMQAVVHTASQAVSAGSGASRCDLHEMAQQDLLKSQLRQTGGSDLGVLLHGLRHGILPTPEDFDKYDKGPKDEPVMPPKEEGSQDP